MNRLSFTIFLIFFFVQKNFNFVLNKLLNPSIFALASETILEHFFPEWFAQSVHACFDLRNYFKIFLSGRVACFDLRKYFRRFLSRKVCSIRSCLFDLRNYFKMFLFRRVAYFDLRKYFRIFLSRKIYSIRSHLFCPQKLF